MTSLRSNSWAKPAIRIAAAGFGAAVAGPLGGAVGGWLGDALGGFAADLVEKYAEKFGDKAAEKLLDLGADSLVEKLKESAPNLESAYRDALRLSLAEVHSHFSGGFDDWFANWNFCLAASVPLDLLPIHADQLVPEKLDDLFRLTLERLDAQGAAMRQKSLSLMLECRVLPTALLSELNSQLPECLAENFRAIIVKPEYEEGWKQAQLIFQGYANAALGRIDEATQKIDRKTDVLPQMAEDTAATRKMLERSFDIAVQEGRVTERQLEEKNADIARLTEELRKLQEQLATRASEPAEARLSDLLAAGNLAGALRLKTQQVETRRSEAEKLPRDLFELGTIHELRFDWPSAFAAHREAWRLERNPEYGFKYAYTAQRQNRFSEAIGVYEVLRRMYTNPADVAGTLNNLAILYRATQRIKEAEEAYREALSIYRELAQANPEAYRPYVATTLNNLALLYSDTQRMKEAEEAYREALSIRRELAQANPEAYLPDVAMTLNNLALLYSDTQRMKQAEEAYREALSTYCELAQANPEAYRPYVALTLNNLALLYSATQRMKQAEEAYHEALSTYRELAQATPEAYRPYVATTLNNLALLYSATQRMKQAEEAYREALSIRRELAQANPEAYLPDVAMTLNNLALLYSATQRMKEAEEACREAEGLLEPLWRVNPEVHGDQMGRILLMRALVCEALGESSTDACALARRALAAAYDPGLKQGIQQRIDRLCVDSQG
jgi:tetratricopeptide (TPR) repeat protein